MFRANDHLGFGGGLDGVPFFSLVSLNAMRGRSSIASLYNSLCVCVMSCVCVCVSALVLSWLERGMASGGYSRRKK